MPEPIFIKLGMYVMAPEPISNFSLLPYFGKSRLMGSHCSLYVHPNFFVFYAVRVVSKESRRFVLPTTFVEELFLYTLSEINHDDLSNKFLTFLS
jgi:hypothetical protein